MVQCYSMDAVFAVGVYSENLNGNIPKIILTKYISMDNVSDEKGILNRNNYGKSYSYLCGKKVTQYDCKTVNYI